MGTVSTINGPIDTDELGVTLMHEHIVLGSHEVRVNFPDLWDEDAIIAHAAKQLSVLSALGVRTIVECTAIGLGRDVELYRKVAERVDLNIIVCTGLYTHGLEIPVIFRYIGGPGSYAGGPDPLRELFIRDAVRGIAGTGIKPGVLKCVIDVAGLTAITERVMRAVAATHRETGLPIIVHTSVTNESGSTALDLFESEGVAPGHVMLSHSGDATDMRYLTALRDRGALLGMDRFGFDAISPLADRIDIVARMCEGGFADSMVLSHDNQCAIDWFTLPSEAPGLEHRRFTHIHDDVLPGLRARGVTETQITEMLVGNPRRFFDGAAQR